MLDRLFKQNFLFDSNRGFPSFSVGIPITDSPGGITIVDRVDKNIFLPTYIVIWSDTKASPIALR